MSASPIPSPPLPELPPGFAEGGASHADLDAIRQIEAEGFPAPWRRDYFEQELTQAQRFNRVIRQLPPPDSGKRGPGDTIAYLFCAYLLDEMHVNKIAVRRDFEGQGFACHLMLRAFDFARTHGVALMTLEVRSTNDRAIRFYERLGFDRIYVRKAYYSDGEEATVMHKTFEDSAG
jgi:ribosomal-protein-alanine N-acetyltransferase